MSDTLPAPELVSWRYVDKPHTSVLVCWQTENGQYFTTLAVDYDIDGPSFHYRAGVHFDPKDEDFEDLLFVLEGDMAALTGSEFIPIRPWFYAPEKRS